ncbi:MAG: methyltransferase [Candidatus Glassbacteria bacterium RIFCSPLOWO2_12_FULL_58_11]|uniref:Methyltransferase n=1 Tax=Candidatus Glassbacteria bacterium RIFCSPLOWO2_12_FULL_58_11 TaxID=1817867 RepID=A0A1F5YKX1_9BACT|nr:MAG: methyltransferase [Candidatus Glassbacteria bacterium RIFCSPLOWO2_12_FULL_58_11]
MALIDDIRNALVVGNAPKVTELTRQALEGNIPVIEILNSGLVSGMDIVANKWKSGEYYIPNVLIAARAMKQGMEIIKPKLIEGDYKAKAVAVAGTVKGDLHDIGKNLVVMMMEGAGFEVVDLGTDVAADKFIQAARDKKADLILMSALLTTTMMGMKDVVAAVKNSDLKGKVKTMVGGAPITDKFAQEIGADGYAPDGSSAVEKAKSLLGIAA